MSSGGHRGMSGPAFKICPGFTGTAAAARVTARIIEPTRICTDFLISRSPSMHNQPLFPNGYEENDITLAASSPVTEGQARKDNDLPVRILGG